MRPLRRRPPCPAGTRTARAEQGSGNLVDQVLDPEDTENFEIGAKAELFARRLTLSGALFQTTRKNAAILVEDGVYEQAARSRSRAWNSASRAASRRIGPCSAAIPIWTPNWSAAPYREQRQASGDPLANTPKNSFSLFTTYRVMPKLSLGGGVYYVDDRFGGNQGGAGGGTGAVYAPSYTRLDLFASYDVTDRASLQLNVKNATDEDYIMRTNGVHHADPAPASQAILTLNVRF
jgi:catecholate siderophore receptor